MKSYIIAGEASGDLHGANLMKQIKLSDPNAEMRFWGGNLMLKESSALMLLSRFRSVRLSKPKSFLAICLEWLLIMVLCFAANN
jgi:hypothetical protein